MKPLETSLGRRNYSHMRCAVAVLWCALLQPSQFSSVQQPCAFNRLCLCSHEVVRDVVCVGVPFSVFPTTIGECENGQVTLVRSGLEVLQNDSLAGTRLSTLRLMHNSLSRILPCAFCGAEDNLVSLDLSNNALAQAPVHAMRGLRHLQWLNLQSNCIDDLRRADWQELSRTVSLRSLFLGENNVKIIRDGLFSNMSELATLELDRNLVSEVAGLPFPESLTHLSLAHNLLEHLPRQALCNLRSLSALFLGGNLLKTLPATWFLPTRHLDQLDLSRNLMDHLPEKLFNGSVYVRDLHMEFNFITELPVGLFRSVSVERLSLANNRMADIAEHVFGGLESVLIVLDLSFNLFRHFPYAARTLASLSVLYLRGNSLTSLEPADVQSFRATLEVLDLSGNRFDRVPASALRTTQRLSRLSLQDNRIQMLHCEDFELWARNLTTLSLANNGIRILSKGTFAHLPRLRELKLSFNAIHSIDHHVFLPLRPTLEVLELSSTLGQRFLPLELIRHMKHVQWLQLDHNQMLNLTDSYLEGLPSLVHFDLEGNMIGHITPGFFKEPIHQRLNRVVLAHNDLNSVNSGTFKNLSRLANVVLLGNKIRILRSGAFKDLPALHNVVLSRNRINTIEAGAFNNLSQLSSLFLQHNNLTSFSLDCLYGSRSRALLLNLSQNSLVSLHAGADVQDSSFNETHDYGVHTLDVRHNQLVEIDHGFLASVGSSLLNLFVSNNKISRLSGIFNTLTVLQTFHADHNAISNVSFGAFQWSPELQVIVLSDNRIESINEFAFGNLTRLRVIDLSHNQIASIPENAFENTALERLNLSFNGMMHCNSIAAVKGTLRVLDLSGNRISSIGAHHFDGFHTILALNISRNQLIAIGENSFAGLGQLMSLDLAHNPLFTLNRACLLPLKTLGTLKLRNCSLARLPPFHLKRLLTLDVAENFLFNLSTDAFRHLRSLRVLDVSRNLLDTMPRHLWRFLPQLHSLDVSGNPISSLATDSFADAHGLQSLDIRRLQLKFLDPRALHGLRFLKSLRTTSYGSVRSFRLQELVSQLHSLRQVLVEVEEPVLSHQLQWAFGAKLSELTVTGRQLRVVFPDALLGLHGSHELVLRLTGTSIRRLPAGLLRYLADVRYLTLDLRDNLLSSIGPEVLRPPGGEDWRGTQHLAGGIRLENNPWVCDCQLLWLSRWLRRWLRETLRVQMLHFDAAIYVHNLARKSECTYPEGQLRKPLIDLQEDDFRCTSSAGHIVTPSRILTFVMMVLISTHSTEE
ncbi:chaoptin [Rhipicephalus sanguineus]|uniref:chaoptin n=1 Tax=Rhipicephalus sanguineus TaxID=34632 RepID=UPI00189607C0|nr:chaoptin [Rhipicephalus sanguineus]